MKKVRLLFILLSLVSCLMAGQALAYPDYGSNCNAVGCHGTTTNSPPTASAGPDQTVPAGQTVSLDGSASSDPDGDALTYAWTQTGGDSVALQSASASVASFTAPNVSGSAALTFSLTVTDPSGESATDTCIVNVSAANQAPTANAGLDRTVTAGTDVSLSGLNSSDADGSIVSYAWTQVSGTSVSLSAADAAETTFSAPTPAADQEALVFELTVTDDGGLSATDQVTVNVTAAPSENLAPTADAGPDQNLTGGEQVSLSALNSTDSDGVIIGYAWTQVSGTPVTLAGSEGAEPTFTAPAATAQTQTLVFELTVTDDGGLSATDECTVTVAPITDPGTDEPPVADAGADSSAAPGAQVTLDGSASSDVEGEVSYLWTQTEGEQVTLSDPTKAVCTFTAPQSDTARTLTFELSVTDSAGQVDTDVVVVNIQPAGGEGQAPVADAGEDQTVKARQVVTLDGSASIDPEGQELRYDWKQVAGRPVQLSDPQAAQTRFSVPARTGRCPLVFELTVTDSDGLQATDRVVVRLERGDHSDRGDGHRTRDNSHGPRLAKGHDD